MGQENVTSSNCAALVWEKIGTLGCSIRREFKQSGILGDNSPNSAPTQQDPVKRINEIGCLCLDSREVCQCLIMKLAELYCKSHYGSSVVCALSAGF